MKTRLLRKLRREAKKRVKIVNPLDERTTRYYIEKTTIENGKITKEWFHYPCYGCFLNTKSPLSDLQTALELLPRAREEYISSRFMTLKIKQLKKEVIAKKREERKYLNKL